MSYQCLLLEDIHAAPWEVIWMSVSKNMTNSGTRNDFHAASALPCSEGDFCQPELIKFKSSKENCAIPCVPFLTLLIINQNSCIITTIYERNVYLKCGLWTKD